MVLYKSGTVLPFSEADYVDLAISRISRLIIQQKHSNHLVLSERYLKGILNDLLSEVKELNVLNTPPTQPRNKDLTNEKAVV